MNSLYFGDNLDVLRENIADESVDLVYLDPPFNSKRDYNLLFKTPKGHSSQAQVTAFQDSWQWGEQAEQEFAEILHQPKTQVAEMIRAMRSFLKESDVMAYLVMMTNRMLELHRVLKPTGSLYLHCDPTASHYLKILLDTVFAPENFRNEIIWKRTTAHNDPTRWGRIHDTLLFYSKSKKFQWNEVYTPYTEEYIARYSREDPDGRKWTDDNLTAKGLSGGGYTYEYKGYTSLWRVPIETMKRLDSEGRLYQTKSGGIRYKRYLDELPGLPIQDVVTDISALNSQSAERLGYPTQKPVALLERIIAATSNQGDVVLDPFCGCGTAVYAAQLLNRRWIGIDITNLAIMLIEKRMREAFPEILFEVHGLPKDIEGARDLANRNKYEFQWWVCRLIGAQPYMGKKKGADSGIDGVIYFQDDVKGLAKQIIVSVKGGDHVTRSMVADLKNSVEREKAQMGFFVTLAPPTHPMIKEASSAGMYESPHSGVFPKIQILTLQGLLDNTEAPRYPDLARGGISFKRSRVEQERGSQPDLL